MIVAQAVVAALGTLLVLAVLVSALETVVLPQQGFTRITRFVFSVLHRLFFRRRTSRHLEASFRALYAPIALVTLPLAWTLLVTIGFSGIFWGVGTGSPLRSFEVSGSSLFTLGFAEPTGGGRIWMTFIEATIGLGLVALLISYLPTVYGGYQDREKGITALRPFGGAPAAPVNLLANLHHLNTLDDPEIWRTVTRWVLTLNQSHANFPALCYFPESLPDQSWLASMGSVLDASALLLSTRQFSSNERPPQLDKGPMMVLAYGVPCLSRIGVAAGLPLPTPPLVAELVDRFDQQPPHVSVTRDEYLEALTALQPVLSVQGPDRLTCWTRYAWIRSAYDKPLAALAGLSPAVPAPWTTDRPARVGRPRLFTAIPLSVAWATDPSDGHQ